jgi:hypothetical protein
LYTHLSNVPPGTVNGSHGSTRTRCLPCFLCRHLMQQLKSDLRILTRRVLYESMHVEIDGLATLGDKLT